jgi:hypothetical protein
MPETSSQKGYVAIKNPDRLTLNLKVGLDQLPKKSRTGAEAASVHLTRWRRQSRARAGAASGGPGASCGGAHEQAAAGNWVATVKARVISYLCLV